MKIAHLSDLHFGHHDESVADALVPELDRQNADLVVISGDFTQHGTENEFKVARSFIDKIGPQGMSYLLRMSIASNFVLVVVHCSMRSKIWLSFGSRAFGVANSGSVFQVGSPITSQIASQTGAWVMK